MADTPIKPLIGKFEVPIPDEVTEEEFDERVTGTPPKTTATGGPQVGLPPDTHADVDVDW